VSGPVAIDVTPAITGRTGIARYVVELSAAWQAIEGAPPLEPFCVGRAAIAPAPGVRHVRTPLRVIDLLWRATGHPTVERLVGPVASVHAAGPVLPPSRPPVVAVVHDLAAIEHPELHPRRDADQLRRYLDALDRAAAVVTVSQTTADHLVARGVDPARVHVTPNGRTSLPPGVAPPLPAGSYVLAVGAPVPRKGFDTLVRAAAMLDGVDVVVVGPPGVEDDRLARLVDRLGVASRYHRPGAVSDAELAGWYDHAAAVAVPSVDEGFGLPAIEALARSVPAVVTDLPVFHEVTGGHACFVPPRDPEALAAALAGAIARGPEVERAIAAGAAHVQRYTWEACAAATVAVHRAVSSA